MVFHVPGPCHPGQLLFRRFVATFPPSISRLGKLNPTYVCIDKLDQIVIGEWIKRVREGPVVVLRTIYICYRGNNATVRATIEFDGFLEDSSDIVTALGHVETGNVAEMNGIIFAPSGKKC